MGPEDLELADKPVAVERRRRPGIVMSVRLSPEEADQIEAIAQHRGTTVSQVAREAITGYLNAGHVLEIALPQWSGTANVPGFEWVYQRGWFIATDLHELIPFSIETQQPDVQSLSAAQD